MRILITGGAGFIGSHLAERYLDAGADVVVLDDLSTGTKDNLRHLTGDVRRAGKIHVHVGSVLDAVLVDRRVADADLVFHLAAAVGVDYVMKHPLSTLRTNIRGTDNVLESCSRHGRKALIASSSEVYGKHLHAPLRESDNILYGPPEKSRWNYAASKLMDEFMALAHARTGGLHVVIVRLFNIIGPRQTGAYGMVVPRLTAQALQGRPLTVYGDGSQSRTFMHVADAVSAMAALMETEAAAGEIVNIGNIEEITIIDLARRILRATGSDAPVAFVPYADVFQPHFEDIHRRAPDIGKLLALTGFEPRMDMDRTLADIADAIGADIAEKP